MGDLETTAIDGELRRGLATLVSREDVGAERDAGLGLGQVVLVDGFEQPLGRV